jgi:trimeric autotransporter adhesin
LSTSGITSSLLSQIANSPSAANQFVTDLNQLAKDLQSGNLSAAEGDYVTLSEAALNGVSSSTATTSASGITTNLLSEIASSPGSLTSFVNELNQLGTDLQNGNSTSAQQDLLALDSTALNAASSAGAGSSGTTSTTSSATSATQGETTQLVHAIVQAMEAGDSAVVGSAMSELASISPSSAGANVLQQQSDSFASSSGVSAPSSISQLL